MTEFFDEYCLVTGATGVIGRPAIRNLLEGGRKVLAIGQRDTPFEDHPHLRYIPLNLHDKAAIDSFFEKHRPSHLIHLAWEATPGKFWHSRENFRWVSSSAYLLDKFVSAGGRKAVLAGSCAEYDWRTSPLDEETSPLLPKTLYSVSKNAYRQMAEVIAKDIELVWARIFFPYGPGEDPKKLISYIVGEISEGRVPDIQNPERAVDFIHLDDVVKVISALAYKSIKGQINICSGAAYVPHQIALECAQIFGRTGIYEKLRSQTTPVANVRVEGTVKKLETIVNMKEFMSLSEGLKTYQNSSRYQ